VRGAALEALGSLLPTRPLALPDHDASTLEEAHEPNPNSCRHPQPRRLVSRAPTPKKQASNTRFRADRSFDRVVANEIHRASAQVARE
jgi:hypothetical protein